MPWADCCRAAVAALCLAASVTATAADPPAYGKVDTFEPGKKYNCVPSADRKSWDCAQAGKVTKDDAPPPAPPAPRHDEPAPAAAAKPPPPAPAKAPPQSAPASAPRTGKLPSYLLAPGASDHAAQAPAAPVAAAPPPATPAKTVAPPEVHTSTNPQPAPAAQPAPTPPATPAPEAAPKPAPESPKPVTPPSAPAAVAAPAPKPPTPAPAAAPPHLQAADHGGNFLDLSGEQYVIELAHGDRQATVAAAHAALHLPHGQAYELHLRQNGADTWLLVWGSFDDVGAARDARSELPADAHAGWPRRVAPLQAEVRRAGD